VLGLINRHQALGIRDRAMGMKFLPKTIDINNRKRKQNNLPVGICAAFSLSGVKFKILTGYAVGS
jgi:hypothetical protein